MDESRQPPNGTIESATALSIPEKEFELQLLEWELRIKAEEVELEFRKEEFEMQLAERKSRLKAEEADREFRIESERLKMRLKKKDAALKVMSFFSLILIIVVIVTGISVGVYHQNPWVAALSPIGLALALRLRQIYMSLFPTDPK